MGDSFDTITTKRDSTAEYNALPVVSYEELQAVVAKWMLVVDPGVVKLILAVMVANRIPSDPCWLFLIAESGGGKSELMAGLTKYPAYYPISQLTPNTFLSGYKNKEKEASLLKRLPYGTTLGFKDFTSLLDGNSDDLKDILGQLREIFDGSMKKTTGTGDEITWEGKCGFIAGSTPILEQRMSMVGAMGERFLSYKVKQPPRRELRAKMRANIGHEKEMRSAIQDAFAGYLKGIVIPSEVPLIPEDINTRLEALTDFVAISRAVVMRGKDTQKLIEYILPPEQSSRAYKQLYGVALALTIMNGGTWRDEDDYILRKLATSSIHSVRYAIIRCIMGYTTQVKTSTVAMQMGYPTSTTRRYLEDLAAISMDEGRVKILTREHQGKGKPDLWTITPEMREILANMGEVVEATKSDSNFLMDEDEAPVGVTEEVVEGPTSEELKEYESEAPKPQPKFGLLNYKP